jgi:2-keto-4-pentenoate hydratase/2-oxohepta-3-ene-1,7-dioic acid hydratase in catechol pathway
MIFPIADVIAYIARTITLNPGDVIATGTPAGVGFARNPPVFLRPGDTIEVGVDGIGVLRNPIAPRRAL